MADQQLIEIAKALSLDARVLDPRRADGVAVRARGRAPVHDRPAAARARASRSCSSATGSTRCSSCATRRRSSATAATWSRTPDRRADDGRPHPPHGRPRRSRSSRTVEHRGRRRAARGRGPDPDAGSSTTSRSRSAPARSWAWPGWSAPAGPRSPASCSGSTGATPARSGSAGKAGRLRDARPRRCAPGIAYLPEDRHQEGLVLDFSIAQNVTLPILPRLFPRFLVRPSTERARRPRATPSSSTCG